MIRWGMLVASAGLCACAPPAPVDYSGPVGAWNNVNGGVGGGQFSPLTQINRDNVDRLQVAWTYASDDPAPSKSKPAIEAAASGLHPSSAMQSTPVIVDNRMVFCTPLHRVIALEPETGKELWIHDPRMDPSSAPSHTCRGVASWIEPALRPGVPCQGRIISTSGDGRLFALDLADGRLCDDFGDQGIVDLTANLGPVKPRELYHTSPPLVVNDLVVIGGAVRDGFRVDAPGGVVRAFDVRSGQLVWAWDPVGPGMTPVTAADAREGKAFTRGTPNVWSFMSADVEHGLIYLPTGNAAVDFYKGGARPIDYYGSSVVALKIDTGAVVWRFQTVNHDIWDYDVAAQPTLYEHAGKIPAIAIATKTGNVFLLNRLTGEPIFPIENHPVPSSDLPGESAAPTQPVPTRPAPLFRSLTRSDVMNFPFASRGCRATFDAVRTDGLYTPPSLQGTLQSPGVSGGFNWGSNSVDGDRRLFIGAILNLPWTIKLVPSPEAQSGSDQTVPGNWAEAPQFETPYSVIRQPFLSATGIPCTRPPWGELVAIDLDSGELRWRRPLGSLHGRVPLIGRWLNVGVPVSGGVMQTAGGLVFAGATIDEHLRAFDVSSGDLLWSVHLPQSAHGIPMTYRLRRDSRQFLVVATGGSAGIDQRVGSQAIVAFTLPRED